MFPSSLQYSINVAFYLFIVYFKKENEIMALSLKWYPFTSKFIRHDIPIFDLKIKNEIFVVYGLDICHELSANPFTKNRDNIDEVQWKMRSRMVCFWIFMVRLFLDSFLYILIMFFYININQIGVLTIIIRNHFEILILII